MWFLIGLKWTKLENCFFFYQDLLHFRTRLFQVKYYLYCNCTSGSGNFYFYSYQFPAVTFLLKSIGVGKFLALANLACDPNMSSSASLRLLNLYIILFICFLTKTCVGTGNKSINNNIRVCAGCVCVE